MSAFHSCKLTFDKVSRVITLQLTLSSCSVIPAFPTRLSLLITFYYPPSLASFLPFLSLSGETQWLTPDCSIRNRGMRRGWRERQTGLRSEASAFPPSSSSPQFSQIFSLSSIHPTSTSLLLSSLTFLSLHNNGTGFIYLLKLLHSCCPDLIVSKQIAAGFSPLFGTWRVNGISHCDSIVSFVFMFLILVMGYIYYLFPFVVCCCCQL